VNLYLLTRADDAGYDEYVGFVVAAPSEGAARKTVQSWAKEPEGTWSREAKCARIGRAARGVQGILLDSFRAG